MSQEDDVLCGLGHVVLHQGFEVLAELSPGLHSIRGRNDVQAFVHVEQVGQGVHHDGVDLWHPFSDSEGFVDLEWIHDGELLELRLEGEFLPRLAVQVHHALWIAQPHEGG